MQIYHTMKLSVCSAIVSLQCMPLITSAVLQLTQPQLTQAHLVQALHCAHAPPLSAFNTAITGKKLFLQQEVPPLSSTNHSAVRSLCDRKEIARGRSTRGTGLATGNNGATEDCKFAAEASPSASCHKCQRRCCCFWNAPAIQSTYRAPSAVAVGSRTKSQC
jgi:hypothetical protein